MKEQLEIALVGLVSAAFLFVMTLGLYAIFDWVF